MIGVHTDGYGPLTSKRRLQT